MRTQRHEIAVKAASGPYDGPAWRATCSCGRYDSGRRGSPGQAEQAGRDHAKAKNEATQ